MPPLFPISARARCLRLLWATACILLPLELRAIILYSGDNSANTTAPDSARQAVFDGVARICDDGGANTRGSAVYVRGKYLLTANHVSLRSHVTFDGITYWARDTAFAPVQIGPSDMKLIKLMDDPGLPDTPLFTDTLGDTLVEGTLIGWGVGRNTSVGDSANGPTVVWQWGGSIDKRWGLNQIELAANGSVAGYTYDYLETYLNRNAGDSEGAATLYDSGSGLFISHNGVWTLAGLTAAVSTISSPTEEDPKTSTFDLFNTGDSNYFVRIGSYVSQIESAIPDLTTYSGWKIDYSLYGAEAEDTADDDHDGIPLLLEFALGGDPTVNETNLAPVLATVEVESERYLELSYTRPDFENGLTYTVTTTTGLSTWPPDSTGVEAPTVIDNGNGTETWTYRRSTPIGSADKGFLRLEVEEAQ